jgi:dipeptidyl aminopeptidase/acylaminoacyl peptidase
VNAVAEIAGPTDFVNWGKPDFKPFDDPQMTVFIPAFGVDLKGPKEKVDEVAKLTSPLTYVSAKWPSTILVHGDSDKLVPVQQAKEMDQALTKAGVEHQLAIIPGGGHDDKTWGPGIAKALEWFKAKLLK